MISEREKIEMLERLEDLDKTIAQNEVIQEEIEYCVINLIDILRNLILEIK